MPRPVTPSRLDFDTILRWCIVVTAGVVAAFILVNSTHSGIAKAPLFVLGALLIVTVVVLRAVLERQVNFPVSTIHLLVALHVPLVLASAYLSFDPVYTPDALAFALACIVFFFAGAGAFPSTLNIRFLFGCLEWITVALCIVGAAQFFFPENLPLVFYLGASHRVPSLLGNSASFSSFLIVVVPVVLARAAEPGISRAQSRFHVAVLAAAVALLVSTQTRSSIAGWFVSVAAFAAMTLRFKKIAKGLAFTLVTVAGILVVLTFVVPRFGARVTQTFNKGPQSTLARRLYFWEAGGKAFVASPLVGHGIGSFERTVFTYRSPDYWEAASEDVVPHAHNEVLEIAVEYGLCGLILSLAVIVLLMKKGISYTRSASGWDRLAAAGLVSSVIGIAVDNLANVTLREPPVALIVWLFLGLLASPALSLRPSRRFAVRLPLPNIAALIPLVVAVLIAMV
ncbi:MAG TPA: O-antigen ligase family protein, partial [Bacteroidota bacterium]